MFWMLLNEIFMATDTLRKLKAKFDAYYYLTIEEIKIARWRRYLPSMYYNATLNYLQVNFYDCSMLTRHVSKKHFLDYQVNMYPMFKWLSWCGFTIWFPYRWEEIKRNVKEHLLGDDLKEFQAINDKISNEIDLLKKEAVDLIHYADCCAKILKDNGFEGKAQALEERYLKLGKRLGLKPDGPNAKPTPEEEKST